MSVDKYLGRRFDPKKYNCLMLACDVWQDLTGVDLRQRIEALLNGDRNAARSFARLDAPVSPCLVLMQRFRATPHVGVFVRGRVLHINEMGVEFQPVEVASRGFDSVRYYA